MKYPSAAGAPIELQAERDEAAHFVEHPGGLAAGLYDIDVPAIEIDAGILGVHARDRRDLQRGLRRRAERAARDAIAAGEERGAGDQQVGTLGGDERQHLAHRAFGLLRHVVVAADHRGHDGARVPERLLHGARGADRALRELRTDAGLLFAAELAEELVHVADDSQCAHHRTSAISVVAPTCSIAPQSVP